MEKIKQNKGMERRGLRMKTNKNRKLSGLQSYYTTTNVSKEQLTA